MAKIVRGLAERWQTSPREVAEQWTLSQVIIFAESNEPMAAEQAIAVINEKRKAKGLKPVHGIPG